MLLPPHKRAAARARLAKEPATVTQNVDTSEHTTEAMLSAVTPAIEMPVEVKPKTPEPPMPVRIPSKPHGCYKLLLLTELM